MPPLQSVVSEARPQAHTYMQCFRLRPHIMAIRRSTAYSTPWITHSHSPLTNSPAKTPAWREQATGWQPGCLVCAYAWLGGAGFLVRSVTIERRINHFLDQNHPSLDGCSPVLATSLEIFWNLPLKWLNNTPTEVRYGSEYSRLREVRLFSL